MLQHLHPTIRPFTGNDLGNQPSASAAGGSPNGEAQSVANELAAFAGAVRRRGIRLDLHTTASQGDAGKQGGPGGVMLAATTPAGALEVANCSGSGSAEDLIWAEGLDGDGPHPERDAPDQNSAQQDGRPANRDEKPAQLTP